MWWGLICTLCAFDNLAVIIINLSTYGCQPFRVLPDCMEFTIRIMDTSLYRQCIDTQNCSFSVPVLRTIFRRVHVGCRISDEENWHKMSNPKSTSADIEHPPSPPTPSITRMTNTSSSVHALSMSVRCTLCAFDNLAVIIINQSTYGCQPFRVLPDCMAVSYTHLTLPTILRV